MERPRLKRGDIVTAVFPGDYGKPRPTVVVQSRRLANLESILLCPLTSDIDSDGPTRVFITATVDNSLNQNSLIMVDKITALSVARCRERIGALDKEEMDQLNFTLALVIGLAD